MDFDRFDSPQEMPEEGWQKKTEDNGPEEYLVPSRLKLDLDTPLEKFLFVAAVIGAIIILGGIGGYFEDGATDMVKGLLAIGTITTVGFGFLYHKTDNFYILDCDRKALLYHFKFFNFEKVSTFANFSQIHAVTVQGVRESSKHRSWWEYRVEIVLESGKVFPLADFTENSFEKNMLTAAKIAELTGASFVKTNTESYANPVKMTNGKYTFKIRPHAFLDNFRILKYFFLFTFGAIALGIIASLLK